MVSQLPGLRVVDSPDYKGESLSHLTVRYNELFDQNNKIRDQIIFLNRSKQPSHAERLELIKNLKDLVVTCKKLEHFHSFESNTLADKYKKNAEGYQKEVLLQEAIYDRIKDDKEALASPEVIIEASQSIRDQMAEINAPLGIAQNGK